MISAHLPPGTIVLCIEAGGMTDAERKRWGAPKLQIGAHYTVRSFFEHPRTHEIGVRLAEITCPFFGGIEWGFNRRGFRVVEHPSLPAEILACLNVDPEQARVLMPEDE